MKRRKIWAVYCSDGEVWFDKLSREDAGFERSTAQAECDMCPCRRCQHTAEAHPKRGNCSSSECRCPRYLTSHFIRQMDEEPEPAAPAS